MYLKTSFLLIATTILLSTFSKASDTTAIYQQLLVAKKLIFIKPDSGYQISLQLEKLSREINYKSGTSEALKLQGIYYWQTAFQPKKAIESYQKALQISRSIGDSNAVGRLLNNIGLVYVTAGNHPKALEYYIEALKRIEALKDSFVLGEIYNNIGNVYQLRDEFTEAIKYHETSAAIRGRQNNELGVAKSYNNIGACYKNMNQFEKSIIYFNSALNVKMRYGDTTDVYVTRNNIASNYRAMGKIDTALTIYEQSLDYLEKHQLHALLTNAYAGMALCFLNQQRLTKAEIFAKKALKSAEIIQSTDKRYEAYQVLKSIYTNQKNYQQAVDMYEKMQLLADTVYSAARVKAIAEIKSNYDWEQQEKDLQILTQQNKLKEQDIYRQRIISIAFGLIVFLVGAIAFMIYRNSQKYLQLNIALEQQQQELRTKNSELEVLNRTKDKLFSIIGHDLRTPIATLRQVLNLNDMQTLSQQEAQMFLQQIGDLLNVTQKTLENLLAWAKMQLKGIQINATYFDIAKVIIENVELHQSVARQKNIQFKVLIPPKVEVFADQDQIDLVLRNLFSNAIKFTHQNGIISVTAVPQLPDKMSITITDTGVGMSQEKIQEILQGNNQISERGTHNEKGTALGLLLCKEFIKKNNGTLQIKSEINKGTSVTFTLPVQPEII
jgi:signal transduction histidine kinase